MIGHVTAHPSHIFCRCVAMAGSVLGSGVGSEQWQAAASSSSNIVAEAGTLTVLASCSVTWHSHCPFIIDVQVLITFVKALS